ncbi:MULTISPECIES: CopG family ribbon-helix-helix protein [Pseudomonas]|uniref:CopG family ribbon-helix-helix protein n=1 Tax=Pseudomonas TaxID=286 RepID=UPI0023D821DC|nr:CopG family ribbon-helix-helix protein [Pseudomonas sp. PSE14]WEJ71359.1 CopG family ribbon-helix-helix protein [Pseudomonas sp. PSE14]
MATSVKLDEEMLARVRELAELRQRSPHWIMREAIGQYVVREEQREKLKRDTEQAWEEFQATGQHVTAEAVENWLNSWGDEDEQAAPKCE